MIPRYEFSADGLQNTFPLMDYTQLSLLRAMMANQVKEQSDPYLSNQKNASEHPTTFVYP